LAAFTINIAESNFRQTLATWLWRREGDRRPQGGRRSFIITPTASRRWTYSWSRQSQAQRSPAGLFVPKVPKCRATLIKETAANIGAG
jgi:hypothetical protein